MSNDIEQKLTKIDYNIDGISDLENSFAKCMNVFGNCIVWGCKCIELVVSVKWIIKKMIGRKMILIRNQIKISNKAKGR